MKKVSIKICSKANGNPLETNKISELLGRSPSEFEIQLLTQAWQNLPLHALKILWLNSLNSAPQLSYRPELSENNHRRILFKTFGAIVEPTSTTKAVELLSDANRSVAAAGRKPMAQALSMINLPLTPNSQDLIEPLAQFANTLGIPMAELNIKFARKPNEPLLLSSFSIATVEKPADSKIAEGDHLVAVGNFWGKAAEQAFSQKFIQWLKAHANANTQEDLPEAFAETVLYQALTEIFETVSSATVHPLTRTNLLYALTQLSSSSAKGFSLDFSENTDFSPEKILNLLLSQGINRALVVVKPAEFYQLKQILNKWELNYQTLGKVIPVAELIVKHSQISAQIPFKILNPANYSVCTSETAVTQAENSVSVIKTDNLPIPSDLRQVAWQMLKDPELVSKQWIAQQFDPLVQTNNISVNFPTAASLINLKNTNQALAIAFDGKPEFMANSVAKGIEISILQSLRRIACSGAEPLAVVANIGQLNASAEQSYAKLNQALKTLSQITDKFGLKLADLDLYLDLNSEKSPQTLAVTGAIGMVQDKNRIMTIGFKQKGDVIFLLGKSSNQLAGSEYLRIIHGFENIGLPETDLEQEQKLLRILPQLLKRHLIRSAHSISYGGLFMALVEAAMVNELGFDISTDDEIRLDAFLFGQSGARVIVSVTQSRLNAFIDFMREQKFPVLLLGHVTKGELRVDDYSLGFIYDVKKTYLQTLQNLMENRNC